MLSRLRSAARILLNGDPRKNKRNPIPAITLEEVAEIKQFFSREKFFIFGHARSGTTLLDQVLASQIRSILRGTSARSRIWSCPCATVPRY